jgi:hypothetical protein
MTSDLASRRYPRVATSLPCSIEQDGRRMRARLWSASCDGVGLAIDAAGEPEPGPLSLVVRIATDAIELPAQIVWARTGGRATWAGATLALDAAPVDVPRTYAGWLVDELTRARAEAARIGALLAWRGRLSLRTLDAALATQAVAGGALAAALRAIGEDVSDEALAEAAAASDPAPIELAAGVRAWAARVATSPID